jgi:hypothetical protein
MMHGMREVFRQFAEQFPDEPERLAILKLRWTDEFACPVCGSNELPMVTGRQGLKCRARGAHPISITAGTLFERSHVPLRSWFRVVKAMVENVDPVSAVELSRTLHLRRQTIMDMMEKLRRLMQRPSVARLTGRVQVDGLVLPYSGGGDPWVIFIAVELRGGRAGQVALRALSDLSPDTVMQCVEELVSGGSTVETNGSPEFASLSLLGDKHRIVRVRDIAGSGMLPACSAIAGQITRWMTGTYKSAMDRKNLGLYLAEIAFRISPPGDAGADHFHNLLRLAVFNPRPEAQPDDFRV